MSAFSFGTNECCFPEKLSFPPISLSVKFPPAYTSVIEANSEEIDYSTLQFVLFGNGLCYGLSFPANSDKITHSWLNLNRHIELTAEYAGFIFGLSLLGNHSFLNFFYVNDLLAKGSSIISVGVLLSVGLKHKSSSDLEASSLISSFIPSFCANGENETEGTLFVQTAALVAIGFIFMGTANKPIVEFLMNEIVRSGVVFLNAKSSTYKAGFEKELYPDSYRFCASIAIGLICNGLGNNETKINAIKNAGILDRLLILANNSFSAEPALLALTLIYLDSENSNEKIQPPKIHTSSDCAPLKKFFIHLYWNCSNLKNTTPLLALIDKLKNAPLETLLYHSYGTICEVYELAANCIALAVNYASSCEESVLHYFQEIFGLLSKLENEIDKKDAVFGTKLVSNAVFLAVNLLFLCLATVFAGSGDLKILKLFRFYHDRYQPYSRHYALHLSLGMLMLGCGRNCLDSNNIHKASFLLIYLLPFFPSSFNDNSTYFQPLRTLWVLSTEPYRMQSESETSLENSDAYEFIETIFNDLPSSSDINGEFLESAYLKSEFFNIFKCGMAPKTEFLKKLEDFIVNGRVNTQITT